MFGSAFAINTRGALELDVMLVVLGEEKDKRFFNDYLQKSITEDETLTLLGNIDDDSGTYHHISLTPYPPS